jgi:hypothetical protein
MMEKERDRKNNKKEGRQSKRNNLKIEIDRQIDR